MVHGNNIERWKNDRKSFYAYVKSKAQVGPRLLDAQGKEINYPGATTDTFNEQFLFIFTGENTTNIPLPENVYTEDQNDWLVEVDITVDRSCEDKTGRTKRRQVMKQHILSHYFLTSRWLNGLEDGKYHINTLKPKQKLSQILDLPKSTFSGEYFGP